MPSDTTFATLKLFMFEKAANVLKEDQVYLLPARLDPLMKQYGYDSMERMVADAYHGKNLALGRAIVDAMTTHETQFFRDAKFWTELSQNILPTAIAKFSGKRGLRIWSAGCSTGQEAYSLSMLLEERFPQVASKTQIYASDVSEAAVATARQGLYSMHDAARGIDTSRMARHFDRVSTGVRVKDAIRSRLRFSVHNLKEPSPFSDMDLVLCRNVLIYFNEIDRRKIVERLTQAACPEGLLVLGSTESLPGTIKPIFPGCYERRTLQSSAKSGVGSVDLQRATSRKAV